MLASRIVQPEPLHVAPAKTNISARIARLTWSRWHWLVVVALGITWILDGIEVTIKSAISGALLDPRTLGLTGGQIGLSGTAYPTGAVLGSRLFGYLTDRPGRKNRPCCPRETKMRKS